MREYRILGNPGSGKTTRLTTRDIPKAVDKFGPDKIMVTSFTKAAAKELISRNIDVNPENVGTLHSICYRALGQPELVVKQINKWNALFPHYSLHSSHSEDLDEGRIDGELNGSDGDLLYSKMQILRAKMIPVNIWPRPVYIFYEKWEEFKENLGIVDFTDLIDQARELFPIAPGNPAAIFLDEAQDSPRNQLELIRSWGMQTEYFILCGDDLQCIYSFSGAVPDSFITPPVGDEFKIVLKKSHRVPKAIKNVAVELSRRIKVKVDKKFEPRDGDPGIVINCDGNWKYPDNAIEKALERMKNGQTVMFIASCSYMLEPLKFLLMAQGIPFHNPFRLRRKDWNPLRNDSAVILSNFLKGGKDENYWSIPQLVKWAKHLRIGGTGLIRKTGKKAIRVLEKAMGDKAEGLHTSRNVLHQILSSSAIEPALNRDVGWLKENTKPAKQKAIDYALKVINNYGTEALKALPKIIIGTIHSIKGHEADVVILFPDISMSAWRGMEESQGEADAIHRLFYVGVTRAKHELIIMDPVVPKRGRKAPCVYFGFS